MDRIDELLEKATPDVARRDQLRNLFTEWERVKTLLPIAGETAPNPR